MDDLNAWLADHPADVSPESTAEPRTIIDAMADGL
jgi:hypothetical protein